MKALSRLKPRSAETLNRRAEALLLKGSLLRMLMHFHCAPGLVAGVANVFEQAVGAPGAAGDAQFASVPDNLVREQSPALARDHAHQVLFDLFRIFFPGQLQAS